MRNYGRVFIFLLFSGAALRAQDVEPAAQLIFSETHLLADKSSLRCVTRFSETGVQRGISVTPPDAPFKILWGDTGIIASRGTESSLDLTSGAWPTALVDSWVLSSAKYQQHLKTLKAIQNRSRIKITLSYLAYRGGPVIGAIFWLPVVATGLSILYLAWYWMAVTGLAVRVVRVVNGPFKRHRRSETEQGEDLGESPQRHHRSVRLFKLPRLFRRKRGGDSEPEDRL